MRGTWYVIASAPTLDALSESVARFYCGERKEIREGKLYGARGEIDGMRVTERRGRFRLEMREGN